jgi:hypothetical protein
MEIDPSFQAAKHIIFLANTLFDLCWKRIILCRSLPHEMGPHAHWPWTLFNLSTVSDRHNISPSDGHHKLPHLLHEEHH